MIESYSFGKIVVEGRTYTHDIKIINDRVVPDWWRKNGHRLTSEDIPDILSARPDLLVVGRGYSGMMVIDPGLRNALNEAGIALIDDRSAEAVNIFNRRYRRGERVAAGFHLTC